MPSKPAFCQHLLDSDNRCNEAVPEATPQRHFHPRELFRLAFPHRPALEPPHAGENPFSSVFSGDCSLRLRSSGKDEHPNHILKITRVPAIGRPSGVREFPTLYKNLDFVIFTGLLVCSTATRGLYPVPSLLLYMLKASPSRVWL
ncbi:hypothetical protein PQX77_009771 [Marasmius sp. AFHP31]|nr:hypothetical protein PQX77_009771 [Marasmius sp. AFHP31]